VSPTHDAARDAGEHRRHRSGAVAAPRWAPRRREL